MTSEYTFYWNGLAEYTVKVFGDKIVSFKCALIVADVAKELNDPTNFDEFVTKVYHMYQFYEHAIEWYELFDHKSKEQRGYFLRNGRLQDRVEANALFQKIFDKTELEYTNFFLVEVFSSEWPFTNFDVKSNLKKKTYGKLFDQLEYPDSVFLTMKSAKPDEFAFDDRCETCNDMRERFHCADNILTYVFTR
jgi:hypothetical protein